MKITIDREVLEQAFDAIDPSLLTDEASAAIREALAQPQQEPAWFPAVENILNEYGLQAIDFVADFKAALAQPQQKPVAEVQFKMTGGNAGIAKVIREICDPHRKRLQPGDKLYTYPPARKPIRWHKLPDTLPPKREDSDRWSQRVWLALPDGSVVEGDCLFAYPDATHGHAVHTWFVDRCQLDADPIAWIPFAVPDHPQPCLPAPPARKPLTDGVLVPLDVLEAAEISLCSFCSDHGWSADDMQTMDNISAHIAKHKATHGIKETP